MWVSHRRADNFSSVKASNFGTLWLTFLQFLHASEHSINDIRYMHYVIALCRAHGSTNAVYLSLDTRRQELIDNPLMNIRMTIDSYQRRKIHLTK